MARNLHVYPKATIEGAIWLFVVKVFDQDTRANSRFTHTIPAGVTATTPLRDLKLSFDLTVGDADTDQDVDDALFVDDIRPGPQVNTVWLEFQGIAEGIISSLSPGYTQADFWVGWAFGDTQAVRNAANRALVSGPGGIGRGWTIVAGSVHQHEGDGSTTDV